MPKFHATLKDPDSEQRRLVTLSRVPCPKCENDPVKRGGFYPTPESKTTTAVCSKCGGAGDVPATADSAAAHLEALEAEYAAFRLDEAATIARYPTLPSDALARVEETTLYVPQDTVLVDGRFVRASKVLANAHPDFQKAHKGWRAFHEQERPFKVMRVGNAGEQMAVTGGQYGVQKKNQMDGTAVIDFDTDTMKAACTTSAYTVDIDTHDFFNDVTNEITGTNYTAGGFTLASKTVTYDTATDQSRCDAADITQASATFTLRRIVYYKSTGTASTSPLLSYLDCGADVSPSAGTFSVVHDATGIYIDDVT